MARRWRADRFGGPEVLHLEEEPEPGAGEVTVEVRGAGVNRADVNAVSGRRNPDPRRLPVLPGFEIAGVVSVAGPPAGGIPHTVLPGDEVVAFRVTGGFATHVTVSAADVFPKPGALTFAQAANLLLTATTAAELLHVTGVEAGDTVLVHGASGALISIIQQATQIGAAVIGTTSSARAAQAERFGATAVLYGPGLDSRVRSLARHGVDVTLDAAGSAETMSVSLDLVQNRARIATAVALDAAAREGVHAVQGQWPAGAPYRDSVRKKIIATAAAGLLTVPIARVLPLLAAKVARTLVEAGGLGARIALRP